MTTEHTCMYIGMRKGMIRKDGKEENSGCDCDIVAVGDIFCCFYKAVETKTDGKPVYGTAGAGKPVLDRTEL